MSGYIHHVEWSVKDVASVTDLLVSSFGFVPFAQRSGQEVLKCGSCVFLISDKNNSEATDGQYPRYRTDLDLDTVFNVCMEVNDVDSVVDQARSAGAEILDEPRDISEGEHGTIRLATIKGCLGNVIHAVVNTKHYSGPFLPGFQKVKGILKSSLEGKPEVKATIDHVTLVCPSGETDNVISWYSKCFGMKRFLVNPTESIDDGIEIRKDVNMRMKVAEWLSSWMCREEGVQFPETSEEKSLKLVLAEPLDSQLDSHVHTFLKEHKGPGVQHIGIKTKGVEDVVEAMTKRGAQFRRPPPTYYKMKSKVNEIEAAGFSVDNFARLGLLLDSEADMEYEENNKALVQIFTKPIFKDADSFFLEVLERQGARGFGAGNITALAESILLYQRELETIQKKA